MLSRFGLKYYLRGRHVGPVFTSLFIDGASCQAQGEKSYGVHNPANPEHIVGYAADASVGDVESAIAADQKMRTPNGLVWMYRAR